MMAADRTVRDPLRPGPLTVHAAGPIAGVLVAETQPFRDERGQFARLFDAGLMDAAGGGMAIRQVNHSLTHAIGAIRGLHFQHPPHGEGKWVRCIAGRVWDVAIDLRAGSPTFLQHQAVELSAAAMTALFVPPGCAHGFQVLEPDSALLYLHSGDHVAAADGGVRWDDPMLAIAWPLPATILSDRDRAHPLLSPDFTGLLP